MLAVFEKLDENIIPNMPVFSNMFKPLEKRSVTSFSCWTVRTLQTELSANFGIGDINEILLRPLLEDHHFKPFILLVFCCGFFCLFVFKRRNIKNIEGIKMKGGYRLEIHWEEYKQVEEMWIKELSFVLGKLNYIIRWNIAVLTCLWNF